MRILVLGAGKMGSFFLDLLSFDHETAVYEKNPERLRFTYNTLRFTTMEEIEEFKTGPVINAVTVKYTIPAFEEVTPHLAADCMISDISSVKTGLKEYYAKCGHRYVSTHPCLKGQVIDNRFFTLLYNTNDHSTASHLAAHIR